MKKIIKIFLSIIVIVWIGFELVNYGEYIVVKSNWDQKQEIHPIPMPGPSYRPIALQLFYQLFPFVAPKDICPNCNYKPVIYLYPTKTEKVKVELDYNGTLIADYPAYDYSQKGWNVTAYPDGKIINGDGKEYSYLFWEGKPAQSVNYDLSTGFVVKGEDTIDFLQTTLSKMGLTPKEYNEFIVYWYPKMKNNKYNLIHFAEEEYTKNAPLNITPKPDSMLRVFMVYKSLNNIVDVKPEVIKSFTRKGFSVIEWGGTESIE